MSKITFPESFQLKPHDLDANAKHWKYRNISIIGGGYGMYGNGINTFEVWFPEEPQPRGYQTKEQINQYINKHY